MSPPPVADTKPSSQVPSPERDRPPLPPRPTDLSLLRGRDQIQSLRPSLAATATTAVSATDVNTYHRPDGTQELRIAPRRGPSSGSVARFGSNRTSEMGEDSSSIKSYLPMRTNQDSESIFEGALDDGKVHHPGSGLASDYAEDNFELQESDVDFEREFGDVETEDASDEVVHALWMAKKKHFLILSAAGKPIYTRHGSDRTISSYIGIIQTIISSYSTGEDPLKSFAAGPVKFVVLAESNLFLVGISSLLESDTQLRIQLEALYMQILSTLTLPTLTHIFSVRPSSDLRRPLQGTEVLLSSLADSFTRGSPSALLSSLESLKIRKSHRNVINSTLIKARVDELLYGLVVAGARLVSVIRPKKHSLHPSDLQLIFNMLFEAEAIKAGGGDSWIPICLPGFNKTGYLFMYVSYLDMSGSKVRELDADERIAKEDAVAIILLSADKESFESMQSMKRYLVSEFHRTGSMRVISTALQAGRPSPTDIVPGTGVRHFLFKSKSNVQYFMPTLAHDFNTPDKRRQLMTVYHTLHASVHAKNAAVRVHHSVSPATSALAWVTPMFELYCVAGPSAARNALAQSANKIVQWIQREEERIFLIGGAVF
jgi:vacuolar fusion protein MON1